MADDINNNEGMDEAGDAGMPDDLKRLLARAEQGEDGDPDAYNPDADDDEEEDDDGELEESFGEVDRGASAGEDINGGQLQISEFGREMKQSFIEYSMSVITARALPDVRDGLKPVHRRILYAMNESGIYPNRPHKKSAWTVGEVIGKYHPHGDSAVYEAMVRLAQWFSMRTPLIDGHGNFGNIDGDGAAAMRYTESRLAKPAMELLRDLQKDTVDWQPNYDESLAEPVALPARFPNLLVNGSQGIAVGMATNIAPHNLAEAIEATCYLIDNPDATVDELMQIMPGPDFPTGAIIMGSAGIKQSYETGRGSITVRAKAHVESTKTGRSRLVFTEIPYMVNKGTLQEKIAQLVNDKRIEGISDMRDESNQKGIRLVIELKKGVIPQVVLNNLYKYTSLQTTFGANNLALVNGVPKCLSLREMLQHYIDHQVDVVTRRTRFDLKKAQARAHILEGYLMVLDHIDEVISIIRSSQTDSEASSRLIERFGFTPEQTTAILEMKLRRLTGLERKKIDEEYADLLETIDWLESVLADEHKVMNIIKEDLQEMKKRFGDERRTEISIDSSEMDIEDLIAEEDIVVTISHQGYIKRQTLDNFRSQKRGGVGKTGGSGKKIDDSAEHLFLSTTHHNILFFTNRGRVYRQKGYEIPEASRTAKGTAIINLLALMPGEKITAVIPVKEFREEQYMFMATNKGTVKKINLKDLESVRKNGMIAINLDDDEDLIGVELTDGNSEIILATRNGIAIRFDEQDVRTMGRTAHGVKGISLNYGDEVVAMDSVSDEDSEVLTATEFGMGKRTEVKEYRKQTRGGKGIINMKITEKTGLVIGMKVINPDQEIMMITAAGLIIRTDVDQISQYGRNTQGVKLMTLNDDDKVVSLAAIHHEEDAE